MVEKKPFSCKRGEMTIRGFVFWRENHLRTPVIMSHAFLSNQKIMEKYAKAMAREGFVVFTYDFCGGAMLGKSDGQFRDMSIDTEKADLQAVIAHVGTRSDVDMNKLMLLGASQGGFVSCLVAAEYGERISKLILLYPALCIPNDARAGKMMMIRFDPANIDATMVSRPFRFSPEYPKSAMEIDVDDVIRRIQAPMLILHGDQDKIVDLRFARQAIGLAANPTSALIVMKDAGHGFKKKQVTEAMAHIMRFVNPGQP